MVGRSRGGSAAALAAVVVMALAGCPAPSRPGAASSKLPAAPASASASASLAASTPPGTSVSAPVAAAPEHVVLVIFENKSYQQVTSSQAPWLHGLMATAAVFTDAHGVTHPSQPNYLALFSGSTQSVTDDHCPVRLGSRPNLARQLLDAGRSFTGYSEDLPGPGSPVCTSRGYAAKHNPWVDFDNVPAAANQPFTSFPTAFDSLPTVSFVVPNLCHDMHDCSVATGDAWARDHLDGYRQWAGDHHSLLVVTFDEDDNSSGNRILTLVAGAGVRPGTYPQRFDHYGLLRAIEDCYRLPPLGAAASAPSITAVCPAGR